MTRNAQMGVYRGLLEDTERYDDDYYDEYDDAPAQAQRSGPPWPSSLSAAARRLHPQRLRPSSLAHHHAPPGAPTTRRARLVRTSGRGSGHHEPLGDGRLRRERLVDFAAGLVFSVRGSIERVTPRCSCCRRPTWPSRRRQGTHGRERLLQPVLTRRPATARPPVIGWTWACRPSAGGSSTLVLQLLLHRPDVHPARRGVGAGVRRIRTAGRAPSWSVPRSSTRRPIRRSSSCGGSSTPLPRSAPSRSTSPSSSC